MSSTQRFISSERRCRSAAGAQATVVCDRTRCGVNYGSGRLFRRLAGHLVNDEIELRLRLVLADGTLVDTADAESVAAFRASHAQLLDDLQGLANEVRDNTALAEKVRHKYRLKNTTGYGLNALLDFDDPVEILQHLMVGSEGTLGCMTEITYHTVVEHAHKATAIVFFPDMQTCCQAVLALKAQPVSAVELMDRACCRSP